MTSDSNNEAGESSPSSLIESLKAKGIHLWEEGGELCFDGPESSLSDDVLRCLKANKVSLLRCLGAKDQIAVVSRNAPLFLSRGQERLWFLEQLDGSTGAYNINGAIRLSGAIDYDLLERALSLVVERHESLRTVFRLVDGRPMQVVLPKVEIPIVRVSLADETQDALVGWLKEFGSAPFDISTGPLVRCAVVKLSEESHVVGVAIHHIVSDGWSSGVFMSDVCAFYVSLTDKNVSPPAPLKIQYADYAQWERSLATSDQHRKNTEFFKNLLRGAPQLLELPMAHQRPRTQSFRGDSLTVEIPAGLRAHVATHARTKKASEFMSWYAIVNVLLSRLSGQRDVVVGTPIANRRNTDLESLIGFFVNTIVLRTDLAKDPSFDELLDMARQNLAAAYDHQDLPFEDLVDALQPQRTLSYNPIFQVLVAWQNAPHAETHLGQVTITPVAVPDARAIVDLCLTFIPAPEGLTAKITWATDLFDRESITRWCESLLVLAQGLVSNPSESVLRAPLLTPERYEMVTRGFNDTRIPYPLATPLHHFIEEQCKRTPNSCAVRFNATSLSYAELDQKANIVARRLSSLGVKVGTFVGICAERSLNLPVAILGVLKCGGVYIPLDPEYPADRLRFMVEDAKAPFLIVGEGVPNLVAVGESKVLVLEEMLSQGGGDAKSVKVSVSGKDLAYMIYTSGSTGRPKGATNTHAGITNRILWMRDTFSISGDDVILQKTPFSFDVSVWEFLLPLVTGATLVMAQPSGHRDPDYLVDVIRDEKVSVIHFVPSMLQVFLETAKTEECQTLKYVFCSGEALPASLQERFFERFTHTQLHNKYGPTEAAVDVTHWKCERDSLRSFVPIGRPIANISTYILDEYIQPVPVGVTGELYLGGVGVGRGYHDRPQLTAERFLKDPFSKEVFPSGSNLLYRTGDLARFSSDGTIEYLGRADFQVKLRGFRIEIGEIESVMLLHPGVQEAVVVLQKDDAGFEMLVGFFVPTKDSRIEAEMLRNFLGEKLPDYMVPHDFLQLDRMPLSSNGKVSRSELPKATRSLKGEIRVLVELETEMEMRVAEEWSKALGSGPFSRSDSFFGLGGHSLLATSVVAHLSAELQTHIGVRELFMHPVLGDFAKRIEEIVLAIPRRDGLEASYEEFTI